MLQANSINVIVPDGANMVNMMWMQEKSIIFELNMQNISEPTLCYWSLANALGYEYNYIPCKMEHGDFVIDTTIF